MSSRATSIGVALELTGATAAALTGAASACVAPACTVLKLTLASASPSTTAFSNAFLGFNGLAGF